MFNFFHRKSIAEDPVDILEILTIKAARAALSDLAIEKAAGMVAKAISKSEFKVQRKGQLIRDDVYWMLNMKPNPNETATEFWFNAIKRLLTRGKCLIVYVGGHLYRVKDYTENDAVMISKTYSQVRVEAGGNDFLMEKKFTSDDVIMLRNDDKKILTLLQKNLNMYNDIANALATSKILTSIPKISMDVETASPIIRTKDENGNEKKLTIDQYKEKIKNLLESKEIQVVVNQSGLKISQMQLSSNVSTEDITKLSREIFSETAYAFDIPKSVFLGEITEKADSTNEFITYAVNWIVEMLNDTLNAALVGKNDYLKNQEKIWVDLSKYKHVDIIESANYLDKLRAVGFTLDEIFELVGWEPLGTEFSTQRAITKNYAIEGEEQLPG